jgi:aldehyde:ferredoxin oxidoreductase
MSLSSFRIIAGRRIDCKIMLDETDSEVNSFDPKNAIVFTVGFLMVA